MLISYFLKTVYRILNKFLITFTERIQIMLVLDSNRYLKKQGKKIGTFCINTIKIIQISLQWRIQELLLISSEFD